MADTPCLPGSCRVSRYFSIVRSVAEFSFATMPVLYVLSGFRSYADGSDMYAASFSISFFECFAFAFFQPFQRLSRLFQICPPRIIAFSLPHHALPDLSRLHITLMFH